MSYNYNSTQKRFYINLTIATSENDKTDLVTFTKDASNNFSYDYHNDIKNQLGNVDGAFHDLNVNALDVGIRVPKTQIIAPPDSFIVVGNFATGQVYVHDTNVIVDLHLLMNKLRDTSELHTENKSYQFGRIDYFDYNIQTNEWSIPPEEFTISILAMKDSRVVTKDRQIILNDKINEITFAQTKADSKGIYYNVDKGTNSINNTTISSLENISILDYEPTDKTIHNRLRLLDTNSTFLKTVYVPNISVKAPGNKWIYIRNRSTGAVHNTYLSEINNIHLYLTSAFGTAISGGGLADLNYINMLDRLTKNAKDWSYNSAYLYTVSAEDQVAFNDVARIIVLEEDPVTFAESNGLNDGTGYRYMNGDGGDLEFNKLDTRKVKVDGKTFYYPIISVRAPIGKGIKITGAAKGTGEPDYYFETRSGFIDDIISFIFAGDSMAPAGYRGLGYASLEGNNQTVLLSDHLGNTTEYKVEPSDLVDDAQSTTSFLNIYDPLHFQPNLYSPNLDTNNRLNSNFELPFDSNGDVNLVERAIFLMRDDYLTNTGNLIEGNLNKKAFMILLVRLMEQETKGEDKEDRLKYIFGTESDGNTALVRPKNLIIIKEDFKGKIERRIRRMTDEFGEITAEPADGSAQTNLHLNSTLHLIYDYTGTNGTSSIRRQFIIQIKEDRDELSFSFDPKGNIDQIIQISETDAYFSNRDHHIIKIRNNYTVNSNTSNLKLNLNKTIIQNPSNISENIPYVPIVKLNYDVQRDLQLAFYNSNDNTVYDKTLTDADGNEIDQEYEQFKDYLEDRAEMHYLISRDILMSYDTEMNSDHADYNINNKAGENLEFGRNYIILDMMDSGPDSTDTNTDWDFYTTNSEYTKGYMKVEFTPILNEIIKVYYQPGQRILKSNISEKVYYRDALTGYISLLHGDQYLNKSMQYFIEHDVNFRVPYVTDIKDDGGNVIDKNLEDRIELRRYRLYLDFVPALPEYNYFKDPKIYDNNMFVTNFALTDLSDNKAFFKFSADETKDDMYKMYISDNAFIKGISGDGKVTLTYETLISEIMYNMEKYFGKARDGDPYDSEIQIGAFVMEESMVNEDKLADGKFRINRISVRPEYAQLQKIIISSDGSTKGADAVIINLTVYMNKSESKPGELLQLTINKYYNTTGYRIKVLQEEREGLKLYNLNHLDTRNSLSFNSVFILHIGLNDSKRIVIRERQTDNIVQFNNNLNGTERNEDQSIIVSKYDDYLRVPLLRKLDIIKEIGADITTIDPAHNLILETYYNENNIMVNNHLVTRRFILSQLNEVNYEFVYILNNRKFAIDEGTYDYADADIDVGVGFFKLVFTPIINKIISVHFDNDKNFLNVTKLSVHNRIYYKDSILNDYVSLINEDFGNFNKELEYFIESTINNVTYRLSLDFRPMPEIYKQSDEIFNLGYMIDINAQLSLAWDTNITIMFSADDSSDDMHQVNLSKSLLLNNISNYGNILLSYTTIRNIIESEMKKLYGKTWYDREMYLFGIISNGSFVMGDGKSSGIKIIISPFEFNIKQIVEIDLDLGTVTYTEGLPDEKWDYSVKSYGEFISGTYEPDDYGNGKTKIKIFEKAFAQAAVLFDERNPDYNVKEVYLGNNTSNNEKKYAVVTLGNVDPTSLQNLVNSVYLPDKDGNININFTTNVNPTYVLNPISLTSATDINHTKLLAKGFNLQHQVVNFYARDYVTEGLNANYSLKAVDDTLKSAYLNPIVHKMLCASLFTKFNNTVFVTYKDEQGLDSILPTSGNYDFLNPNYEHIDGALIGGTSSSAYRKRDLIMAKIKSELQTKLTGERLHKSNLFKLYNALGKYETDLESMLQRIGTTGSGDLRPTAYDLEDFAINLLVKFKGTVSGSNSDTNTNTNVGDEETDKNPNVNSGASNNEVILQQLTNEFFPQSNVYVDSVDELGSIPSFNSRLRYETLIKFQFINKSVTPPNDMIDFINL